MKQFLKKTGWFVGLFLLLLIIPSVILYNYSENFKSIESIVTDTDNKYLVGYAHNENNYKYLKWANVNSNPKRDILALGSSRVLQFRSEMFTSSFYNSGYTISSLNDFLPFIKSIPKNRLPNVLIIGLDQWMFNYNWDKLKKTKDKDYWSSSFTMIPKGKILFNVYKDFFKKKIQFSPTKLANDSIIKIGMNAYINNKGFRNDGSMFYGSQIEKLLNNDNSANDYNLNDTYKRINNGKRNMEYGEAINKESLIVLDTFLNYCKQNDVFVVGFAPPFAIAAINKMNELGKYAYMSNIEPECNKLFNKYNYEFYNYSNPSIIGANDSNNIDGMHGGEVTYLKMLLNILDSDSKLNGFTNVNQLKKDLESPINRYVVYPY